jgi:inner membrane protein
LFHLLLLAIAEHAGFDVAYIAASLATVTLVALYSWAVFDRVVFLPLASSLLYILHGYFYFTIRRQEYSLLASSIGLFIIIAALMYFTRKVDWYRLGRATKGDIREIEI